MSGKKEVEQEEVSMLEYDGEDPVRLYFLIRLASEFAGT